MTVDQGAEEVPRLHEIPGVTSLAGTSRARGHTTHRDRPSALERPDPPLQCWLGDIAQLCFTQKVTSLRQALHQRRLAGRHLLPDTQALALWWLSALLGILPPPLGGPMECLLHSMLDLTPPGIRLGTRRLTWSWRATLEHLTHLLLLPPHREPLTRTQIQLTGRAILQQLLEMEETNTRGSLQRRAHWSIQILYHLC